MPKTASLILLTGILAYASAPNAQEAKPAEPKSAIEQGRQLALERTKGNCAVCHQIPGVDFYGDIAPPLIAMQQRFPDKDRLRAQIWDATQFNPTSVMPPFGRHQILTEEELDKVVEWLYTL